MRRRRPVGTSGPGRLVEYRAEDWQGVGCHPECAYWAAVSAWMEAHPEDDLLLEPGAGPDAPWHPELI